MRKHFRTFTLLALPLMMMASQQALAQCNTRGGFVKNQPDPLPTDVVVVDTAVPSTQPPPSTDAPVPEVPAPIADADIIDRFDDQTILIDLTQDLDSLTLFEGKYTQGVSVLGVRWENTPNFDPAKHCNAVQPILYKPKIEKLDSGLMRASVENGRFSIDFDPMAMKASWVIDKDESNRFIWIFPHLYGHNLTSKKPWMLTKSYDSEFQKAPISSAKRRWIAEAYLNLSMRLYRQRQLSEGFPTGYRPTRDDLTKALEKKIKAKCDALNESLVCLASHLIEENEAAPPGNLISADAFRVGDALLENSGVSTGIRQLDFGTSNDQAAKLVKSLLPNTVGRFAPGAGYRKAIRKWDIATLNRWYKTDGPRANRELSRSKAKNILIKSHVDFIHEAVVVWDKKLIAKYPDWSQEERKAVALFAIDLENVSGHKLFLPTITKPVAEPVVPPMTTPEVPATTTPAPTVNPPVTNPSEAPTPVTAPVATTTSGETSTPSVVEAVSPQTIDTPAAVTAEANETIVPQVSKNVCLVLMDTTIVSNNRSNKSVVTNQIRRVQNGVKLLRNFSSMSGISYKCISGS